MDNNKTKQYDYLDRETQSRNVDASSSSSSSANRNKSQDEIQSLVKALAKILADVDKARFEFQARMHPGTLIKLKKAQNLKELLPNLSGFYTATREKKFKNFLNYSKFRNIADFDKNFTKIINALGKADKDLENLKRYLHKEDTILMFVGYWNEKSIEDEEITQEPLRLCGSKKYLGWLACKDFEIVHLPS